MLFQMQIKKYLKIGLLKTKYFSKSKKKRDYYFDVLEENNLWKKISIKHQQFHMLLQMQITKLKI